MKILNFLTQTFDDVNGHATSVVIEKLYGLEYNVVFVAMF